MSLLNLLSCSILLVRCIDVCHFILMSRLKWLYCSQQFFPLKLQTANLTTGIKQSFLLEPGNSLPLILFYSMFNFKFVCTFFRALLYIDRLFSAYSSFSSHLQIPVLFGTQEHVPELRQEIYQNSNSENCFQTEWNDIKKTAQYMKRRYKQHSKYKRRHGWTNLKKIEADYDRGFWKLVSLTVFQSWYLLFVTLDVMIDGSLHVSSCRFVCSYLWQKYFLSGWAQR